MMIISATRFRVPRIYGARVRAASAAECDAKVGGNKAASVTSVAYITSEFPSP